MGSTPGLHECGGPHDGALPLLQEVTSKLVNATPDV